MDYLDYTELRHHGIQGMKWGVRRYQNEDGSLTAAGRDRYQKKFDRDGRKFTKSLEKSFDKYDALRRSQSQHYYVDKNGANSYDSNGNPSFDTSKGILVYDRKKRDQAISSSIAMDKLEKAMKKKYDSVDVTGSFDSESGKALVNLVLEKNGKTSTYTLDKDYGEFEIPIQFITSKK